MSRPYKQFETFGELEAAVKEGNAVPLDHVIEAGDDGYKFKVYRGNNNIGAAVYTGTSTNPDLEDLKQEVNERIFSLSKEEQAEFMERHNRPLDGPRSPQQMTKEQFDAEVAAGTAVRNDSYSVEHGPDHITIGMFGGYEESGAPKIGSWTGSEEYVCDLASDFSLAEFREQLGDLDDSDFVEDDEIEQEIQGKGLTAPRVTPADIESNIASEHYFTAAAGVVASLPKSASDEDINAIPAALGLLTFCVLVLKNGFTVTGESACASPESFDADLGRKIARKNAVEQIWPLMGYELKSQLHKHQQWLSAKGLA